MRISFHDGERRQLLLAYEPGKSLNDLQDLFDGERYDIFGGGAALVLTRGVWNQVFSMDDPEMNYDSARALAKDYILKHEKIKGLKECELTCHRLVPERAILGSVGARVGGIPASLRPASSILLEAN